MIGEPISGGTPVNLFAGDLSTTAQDLNSAEGWDYVITSMLFTLVTGEPSEAIVLTDAQGKTRLFVTIGDQASPENRVFAWRGEMYLGDQAGATILASGSQVRGSIDGYAVTPPGSLIFAPPS